MTFSPLSGSSGSSGGDAPEGRGPEAVAAPEVMRLSARVAIADPLGSDSEDYAPTLDAVEQLDSVQTVPSTPGKMVVSLSLISRYPKTCLT